MSTLRDGLRSHEAHLAEMRRLFHFLQRSKCYSEYFDDLGEGGELLEEEKKKKQ